MLACGLAVVAADVGAMPELFAGTPDCLYRADDAADLASRIRGQLASPAKTDHEIADWASVIAQLEPRLRALVER